MSGLECAIIAGLVVVIAGGVVYILAPKAYAALKQKFNDNFYVTEVVPLLQNAPKALGIIKWINANIEDNVKNTNILIDGDEYRIPLKKISFKHNGFDIGFQTLCDDNGNATGVQLWTWKRKFEFGKFAEDKPRIKSFRKFLDGFDRVKPRNAVQMQPKNVQKKPKNVQMKPVQMKPIIRNENENDNNRDDSGDDSYDSDSDLPLLVKKIK